jgi:hypothetical protein
MFYFVDKLDFFDLYMIDFDDGLLEEDVFLARDDDDR